MAHLRFYALVLVSALVAGVGCGADSGESEPETAQAVAPLLFADSPDRIPDHYLVVYRDADDAKAKETTEKHQKTLGAKVDRTYQHALHGYAAALSGKALAEVRKDPNVAYVEADQIAHAIADELNPPSWGIDRVDQKDLPLDDKYTYRDTAAGVNAYIVDTGVRFAHAEFEGRALTGYDFVDNDTDASDCHGHGTHVAGTVGGATVGIAKDVRLIAVRVLNCQGSGAWSTIISGIDWVTNHDSKGRPKVGNMSIGGGLSLAVNQAVNNSFGANVVWAVAAGNEHTDACTRSPASASKALTVGATNMLDVRSSFSNYGSCLDLFAPGEGITSSTMDTLTSTAAWSGTSMATPHVTGIAALYRSTHPTASAATASAAIVANATPNRVSSAGTGSPNLLAYALGDEAAPTITNVYVGRLDGSGSNTSSRRWTATVTIGVQDAAGLPITNATVSGTFKNGTTASCATKTAGTCSVSLVLNRNTASTTFTVSNVTGTNMNYVPGSKTSVTISRPSSN